MSRSGARWAAQVSALSTPGAWRSRDLNILLMNTLWSWCGRRGPVGAGMVSGDGRHLSCLACKVGRQESAAAAGPLSGLITDSAHLVCKLRSHGACGSGPSAARSPAMARPHLCGAVALLAAVDIQQPGGLRWQCGEVCAAPLWPSTQTHRAGGLPMLLPAPLPSRSRMGSP